MGSDLSISTGDSQLREDLADAMRESPGRHSRDSTGEFFPSFIAFYFQPNYHTMIYLIDLPVKHLWNSNLIKHIFQSSILQSVINILAIIPLISKMEFEEYNIFNTLFVVI